jgi:hypothetical protein
MIGVGNALVVTAAATLFESVPFVFAATLMANTALRRNAWAVSYLGCGCGPGPSARSLPAAAVTTLLFGPLVAGARLAAAILVARKTQRKAPCAHGRESALADLTLLEAPACTSALLAWFGPLLLPGHLPAAAAFAAGSAAAFAGAPCAIGAAAIAASLRSTAPAAAAGFLCVAGIADLRLWLRSTHGRPRHDALAYVLLAFACALVALRGGSGLLHPVAARALWPCAAAAAYWAWRHRAAIDARMRIVPALMIAGAVLGAPLPEYHATQTLLQGAYAGERIDFTGEVVQTGEATTVVRYAVTCCRADAAPIVVRLAQRAARLHGWVRVRGTLESAQDGLRLGAASIAAAPAPGDPFLYR